MRIHAWAGPRFKVRGTESENKEMSSNKGETAAVARSSAVLSCAVCAGDAICASCAVVGKGLDIASVFVPMRCVAFARL